jgi:hypothetical protein
MNKPTPLVRDGMIHNAVETRRADETKIMQKVNAVNREAFLTKFPGQIEHIMRLVSERLQFCLSKPEGVDLTNPDTWPAQPDELMSLSHALRSLNEIHHSLKEPTRDA